MVKHGTSRRLERAAATITEVSPESAAMFMREGAECIDTLRNVNDALKDALREVRAGAAELIAAVSAGAPMRQDDGGASLYFTAVKADRVRAAIAKLQERD